jgi:transcriptional regulator of acetoin/glycerol metabolism
MFSEQYAGTNGIGTALEERKAFRVRGNAAVVAMAATP